MLATLVTAKSRRRLLTLFLTHPEQRFYHAQIVRDMKIPVSAAQTELKKLSDIGFLKIEREANIKFYKVNKDFPLYNELKSIIYKTIGLADALKENLSKIGHIDVAFIYGSVAKNTEDVRSDIDLMIIGDPDMDEVHNTISKAEDELSREINFTVFNSADWQKRIAKKQSFVMDVLSKPKIFLINGEVNRGTLLIC